MLTIPIKTTRTQRMLGILIVGLVFLLLQTSTGLHISTVVGTSVSSTFWILYVSYALISLLFYCIGSLCWLYAYGKQHTVTTLLFTFTSLMMVAFGTLSVSSVEDGIFTAIGSVSTTFAVLVLFFLLLHFPYPVYGVLIGKPRTLLRASLILFTSLASFASLRTVCVYMFHFNVPDWWRLIGLFYYMLVGSAIVLLVIFSSRRSTTIREQQQSRFFFLGTLLSFVPILGLTVIPTLLHARLVVDGGLSMIFLVLFPLTMGYAVLRYNLLVFDSYVKRVVTTVVSVVGLALLTFVLFAIGSVLVSDTISLYLAGLLLVGVIAAPCIWWSCKLLTERVFFPEAQYYKRVLKQVQQNQAEQSFDLQQVAHLLVIDAMTTLNAPGACVFVLDEETNTYVLLATPTHEAERTERVRTLILTQIASCLSTSVQGDKQIDGDTSLVRQLNTMKRPLFWSEVVQIREEVLSDRVTRYVPFAVPQEERSGPLFAPLRSPQGVVIGVVVMSERGDEQRYGGPDLEALVQLLQLSALPVETARQFQITMHQQERTTLEREEAYEQQRQLNEMKDQLIIHMSHELRTPLAEVSGYLELMNDFGDALEPEMRTLFIKKATHGCDELLQLLSTILAASQSKTIEIPARREDIALVPLIQEEIEHLDPIQAQQHTLVMQTKHQFYAQADDQSLRQIIRNLLSNALKYAPAQTTITVSITTKASNAVICVKDEGPGITATEMPLLFGKFVRLARHHSGSIRGTGLGLYISKQMVEAMGGRIWAESSGIEGEGTAFFVQLPQRNVSPEASALDDVDPAKTPVTV